MFKPDAAACPQVTASSTPPKARKSPAFSPLIDQAEAYLKIGSNTGEGGKFIFGPWSALPGQRGMICKGAPDLLETLDTHLVFLNLQLNRCISTTHA